MAKEKKIKIKRDKNPRQIKLDKLKNDTSISTIVKELTEGITDWSKSDTAKLRQFYYTFKMWTLDAEPNRELKKMLEVSINQTKVAIARRKKMGKTTENLEEELLEYEKDLRNL